MFDDGRTLLSAAAIARDRGLKQPSVAKILSSLAQAGLVRSVRGPGGGYALARCPEQIVLYDIFRLFEREDRTEMCPFGGGICGVGDGCALHDCLRNAQDQFKQTLRQTTLSVFLPTSSNGKPGSAS